MEVIIDLQAKLTEELLEKIEQKDGDWKQELIDIGIVALRSIDLNYTNQGRPNAWIPSGAAIERNGMTLVDSGRLRRSTQITAGQLKPGSADSIYELSETELTIGTQVPYYKYLHETWPAVMLQDDDHEIFNHIILRGIQNL